MTAQEPQTKAADSLLSGYSLFDDERRDYVPSEDFERFLADIEAEAREQAERDIAALREAVEAAKVTCEVAEGSLHGDLSRELVRLRTFVDRAILKDTDEAEI